MTNAPSMLIVEDDDALRGRLERALMTRGFDVRSVPSVATAREAIAADPPELALLDLRVGDGYGLDLIETLRAADPNTRIVVLTGYGSIATAVDAVRRGAVQYLTKPAEVDEILAAFDASTETLTSSESLKPMSLDRVEWEHINRVLVECGGNVSEAARVLGLHRRSLQRKLSKFPRPS